jgi:lysozyme family protein
MAQSSYAPCLARLKMHEGGYTDNPHDPGGPTNFGITIADYRKYVKPRATVADVGAMTWDEAARIYRARYWDAQACDDLPAGVDDSVFDYGVNSGIGRSKKVLQRVVGVMDDGVLGPQTMAAVAARKPEDTIRAINSERLLFLKSLRTWPVFGKGWARRVAEVEAFSLQLATKASQPSLSAPSTPQLGTGKGVVPLHPVLKAAVERRSKVVAAAIAACAIGAAGFREWIETHLPAATVIGAAALLAIAGAGYGIARWRQVRQEAPTPATPRS